MMRYARGLVALCCALMALPLCASNVRWVTSRPIWSSEGVTMVWNRNDLTYWIDNGPLSSSVSNVAATAMVAAAAGVWNIQYSNLSLTRGGSLSEDVSSNNVYLGNSGPIWPTDVSSANYTSMPIAVIFDTDGTITDLLLGSGASAPSSCRQNAVTESVDLFVQPGQIAHAIIILNGRCVGAAPEQLLQMQYQLMRAFGRVLGIGWSQLNDNVFTGAPQPTYQQQQHWPVMHPIDIVCGSYTYQCMVDPFTLRDDDKSALRWLYGTSIYNVTNGQVLEGALYFPNGQGMNGVNMVAVRQSLVGTYGFEGWETGSNVSGSLFRNTSGNPVSGYPSTFPAVQGKIDNFYKAFWVIWNVPVVDNAPWDNVYVTTQAVNPLYVGSYAVGPFSTGAVLPSGLPTTVQFSVVTRISAQFANIGVASAATDCSTGNDGTVSAPAPVTFSSGGVWTGRLCGYNHTSWGSFAVQAGRTATLEAMALDENGAATTGKAHLMLGFWHGSDSTSILPTIAATVSPFNGRQNGTTQIKPAFTAAETVRFAVAEERGEGRPDFTYTARLLYADSVSPARMNAAGGPIRILGTGFQPGNTVLVGGVAATVTSLSSTEIDAVAPALATLGGTISNDVTVSDLRTGGTTTITAGLVYAGATSDVLTTVQAPSGTVSTGVPATFSVRLLSASGSVISNTAVTFTVRTGSALYNTCALTTCTVLTDNTGLAAVSVTATSAGPVTLSAAVASGASVSASFVAVTVAHSVTAQRAPEYVAAGPGAVFNPAVQLLSSGSSSVGVPVAWSVLFGGVSLSTATLNSNTGGTAQVAAIANLAGGAMANIQACAWSTVCTTIPIVGVAPDAQLIIPSSGDSQVVSASTSLAPVTLRVTDTAGHGVAGATVLVHQAVYGWQPPCPSSGRCATAPLYGTYTTSAVSNDDGLITVTPLQYAGTAAVTRLVAATGTTGYFAATLTKQP